MSNNFARIFQQAEKTFTAINAESYKTNFQQLKKFVDKLILSDLNINLNTEKIYQVSILLIFYVLTLKII